MPFVGKGVAPFVERFVFAATARDKHDLVFRQHRQRLCPQRNRFTTKYGRVTQAQEVAVCVVENFLNATSAGLQLSKQQMLCRGDEHFRFLRVLHSSSTLLILSAVGN